MEIKELEKIVKLLKDSGATECEYHQGDTQLKMKWGGAGEALTYVAQPEPRHVLQPVMLHNGKTSEVAAPVANGAQVIDENFAKVESPIVGTFYRKPAPDAEPFVKEGDVVKKGDTLCIIEAMKVMNEIDSPVSGKIEKILVSEGGVVEFGEILFLINSKA